jgi:diguanylate cyclase (GGDEF)-like protein/PAS domain S-box-containing protein
MDFYLPRSILSFLYYIGTVTGLFVALQVYLSWRRREEKRHAQDLLRASDDRWLHTVEEAGSGTWSWDLITNSVQFSKGTYSVMGFDDVTDANQVQSFEEWRSRVHKDDISNFLEAIQTHLNGLSDSVSCEYRILASDGTYKWLEVRGVTHSFDNTGSPTKMVGTQTDITPRKVADELMQLSTLVYQCSSEAMLVCDRDFQVLSVNPAYTTITGYALKEIAGKRPSEYRAGPHGSVFYEALWNSIATKGKWDGELWAERKNGEQYLQWVAINTIRGSDRSLERYVILFSDITDKKRTQDIIWRQANFDSLTDLPNRRRVQEILSQELVGAMESGSELALMILDLDGFKEVNDTLGHDRGDVLLQAAATRLRSCLGEKDILGRMGGDEFIVILPNIPEHRHADSVACAMLECMSRPFDLISDVAYISGSVGITFSPKDGVDVDILLKNADQAMYAAKNAGRNRVGYFDASMQEAAQNRMQLANDLRRALTQNEFKLVYQPIIELKSGLVYKAEALLRWHHPRRGTVSPAEFIPVAEETGSIVQIGDWVFQEAARQAAQWRLNHQPNFQISVNVSPAQFKTSNASGPDGKLQLNGLGIAGDGIVVEITEGLLLDANEAVNDKLLGFRDAGIQVSLDDFGTGYSSLSYLKKFDIDYIKIDQSFVRNMGSGTDDLALCEAIIVMAHKLGMKVIAEGVETEEQRDLLLAAGCDYGQGYLFSRPVPAEQLEPMLKLGCLIS